MQTHKSRITGLLSFIIRALPPHSALRNAHSTRHPAGQTFCAANRPVAAGGVATHPTLNKIK